jgi:hypothetical protein
MPGEKAAAKVEQRDSQDARQLWTRKHQTLQLASDYVPTVPTLGSLRNLLRSIEFEHLTLVHSTATGNNGTVLKRLQQPREDTAARASQPSLLAKLNPAKGAATKHTPSFLLFGRLRVVCGGHANKLISKYRQWIIIESNLAD